MLNGLSLTLRQQVLVILGAAAGLSGGFSPVFLGAMGIVLKPMAVSFNWSRADVAMLPMLGLLGLAIGAPLIGYIADRKGWNKVIAFSIVLFPLGLLAMAIAPPSHAYIIVVGLLTGIAGAGTTAAGYIAVISLAFERRLGMAMGLATIGLGVGAMTMPVIVGKLIEVMDWRQAYACIGGYCLLLGLVAHRLIFRNLETHKSGSSSGKIASPAEEMIYAGTGISLNQAIGGYRFWVIGAVGALVAVTLIGAIIHLVSYATDRGISPALAAQSAGLAGFGVVLARTGVGFMLDRIFAPFLAFGVFLLSAAGLYLLTTDIHQFTWVLPLAAILVGVSAGAEGDLIPFLTKKYFGVRAFGSIYGTLMGIAGVGGAFGAYIYGLSFDLLKSYIPVFQAAAILLCACSLAMLTLGRYQFASPDA